MKIFLLIFSGFLAVACQSFSPAPTNAGVEFRRLPVSEFRDKMKAGWIGQMAGVAWGAPTEFRYLDRMIPSAEVPTWSPAMINQGFTQDDLYVEMTFLRSTELHGTSLTARQAGIGFANSTYALWQANAAGRFNLRNGIAPPDSGHPQFNPLSSDIDYQIEADFSGLVAPGMPNAVIAMGDRFGHMMNYGDGVYAGQFMGGMIAEAFFSTNTLEIIQAGLRCIPSDSEYAKMVRDMVGWYQADSDPATWEDTWQLCTQKYLRNPAYQQATKSNGGSDCKIAGAYVLMGLLYGQGDPDQTIIISMRCGLDSDCNPSSAAGVLFTSMGYSNIPEKFKQSLVAGNKFSHTPYSFDSLTSICEQLARQWLVSRGGTIETNPTSGEEVFVVPVQAPVPSALEKKWAPGPIANSKFTEEEEKQIIPMSVKEAVETFAPGWTIRDYGYDMEPGLRPSEGGRSDVLVTHPLNANTPCVLSKEQQSIPSGKITSLKLTVGHHPNFDWRLIVKINGQQVLSQMVGPSTATNRWLDITVPLSAYAGQSVKIELLNQSNNWAYEAAYWDSIAIESIDVAPTPTPGQMTSTGSWPLWN